ncbi:retrovirus-related pol polyprotein from transposon TNT 1-94 [Tanacetum coccineum]
MITHASLSLLSLQSLSIQQFTNVYLSSSNHKQSFDPNTVELKYYSQSSTTPSSTYAQPHFADNTQLDLGLSLTENLIENLTNTLSLLTQSYKTYLPQTNNQLRTSSNQRNQAIVQDGRVVVQNVQGRQNRGQGNNAWGAGAAGYGGAQNRVGNANPGQARQIKCYNCNGIGHIARNCTQPKRPQNSEYFKDKMLLMQAQENGVALDEEQLLFLADDCNAFDSDVDEAPTAQTMFMENLSSTDPVCNEASPSYDSDILSEVHDHDHYQDAIYEHHEAHEMYDDVQTNYIVDSHVDYTSDSNMIPYDQSTQNTLVDKSLTAELATYKAQVELKFEKGTSFYKNATGFYHLHKQVNGSEVTSLKKNFKQKENKYLEEFLDMKALKEKKNLLIANDNLIDECLSKDVFYVAMNSELTVSRFTKMHDAHTVVQARCLELEIELSKLHDKVQKDDHAKLVKRFSNLEDHVKPKVLAPGRYAIDVEPIPLRNQNNREVHLDYLKHLKESVETLCEIVEEAKVERPLDRSIASACLYTKHSQELVYYVEGLGQNLFSVRQFCDSDLEVAFKKHSCYVRDTDGVELNKGSRGSNLYTISVKDMMKSSPICLLSKASKNKSWLWHRRLNHLNFGTINNLARKDLHFSPKYSSEDSTAERHYRKTKPHSCRGYSDNVDIFQGSDVSMGRSCSNCLLHQNLESLISSNRQTKTLMELVHNKEASDLPLCCVFGDL